MSQSQANLTWQSAVGLRCLQAPCANCRVLHFGSLRVSAKIPEGLGVSGDVLRIAVSEAMPGAQGGVQPAESQATRSDINVTLLGLSFTSFLRQSSGLPLAHQSDSLLLWEFMAERRLYQRYGCEGSLGLPACLKFCSSGR